MLSFNGGCIAKVAVLLFKSIKPITDVLHVALIVLLIMQVLHMQPLLTENTVTSTDIDGSIYGLYTIHRTEM